MEADSNVYMNLDPGSETTTDVRQEITDDGTGTLMETYSSDNSNHTKSITLLREAVSLPYLMVKLPSKILVTVLLDSASSVNFVTKESLKAMPHTLGGIVSATIKTLSGLSSEKLRSCSVTLKPTNLDQELKLNCLVIDNISTVRAPFSVAQLPSSVRVDELQLPPPGERVDVLLGCVDFLNIMISHQKLTKNVFLIRTILGSTIA